jgi:hypothetical protein
MARAIHHEVGPEPADDVAHRGDALLRASELLNVDRRFRAEFARELEPRLLRRADADHPPCSHFLRGRDRENPDRAGALDHHGRAP